MPRIPGAVLISAGQHLEILVSRNPREIFLSEKSAIFPANFAGSQQSQGLMLRAKGCQGRSPIGPIGRIGYIGLNCLAGGRARGGFLTAATPTAASASAFPRTRRTRSAPAR